MFLSIIDFVFQNKDQNKGDVHFQRLCRHALNADSADWYWWWIILTIFAFTPDVGGVQILWQFIFCWQINHKYMYIHPHRWEKRTSIYHTETSALFRFTHAVLLFKFCIKKWNVTQGNWSIDYWSCQEKKNQTQSGLTI